MPVLVTGATGVVGRGLIPRLVESGGQVRVYARRDVPEYRSLGVHVAVGEADHEGRLESALEQVHTLVHLVGGPAPERGVTIEWLNLETTRVALRAAENAEVVRVIFLSHLGADPASPHPYLAAKGHAEEAIRAAPTQHAILRCAPILAPRSAFRSFLERGVAGAARSAQVTPLKVQDVVSAIVAADKREAEIRGTWELGGREATTLGALADRVGGSPRGLSRFFFGADPKLVALYARNAVADPSEAIQQLGIDVS